MTSSNPVDDIRNESLPVEVTIYSGKCLLVPKVAKSFMDVIDEDIPNSLETTAVERNLDIGDTKTEIAGGTVLVEKTGGVVHLVYRIRIHDGEGLREESVVLVAVSNRVRILVDGDREMVRCIRLIRGEFRWWSDGNIVDF